MTFSCHGFSVRVNGMRRHLYQVQFQLIILDGCGDTESEFGKMRISKCIFLLQMFYANEPPVLTSMQNTSF